jgi:V/A-type H+-transporting ATPase subunit C
MSRTSRLDYAYAVGRVRALENNLVSKPAFDEAAEEKDLSSALKIIFDAGQYHQEQIEMQDTEQLDDFLAGEKTALHALIAHILRDDVIEKMALGITPLEEALDLSRSLDYPFITDYLRHKIDLGNLKIICRAKYLELPADRLEGLLFGGGFLDERVLLDSYDLSFGEIGEKIRASAYYPAWIMATDELVEKETFIALEREFANFLMYHLRKAKFIVFGPEPVFAYALAKQQELQLVRFLGVGKLNRIPAQTLKERLSETYV